MLASKVPKIYIKGLIENRRVAKIKYTKSVSETISLKLE